MAGPVLVVEDHDDSRELVESILRYAGYAVATAVHGRDALDQIDRGLRPCLILLDVTMPVMDGPDFAEKLHASNDKELATTPIVLLTALFDTASAHDQDEGTRRHFANRSRSTQYSIALSGTVEHDRIETTLSVETAAGRAITPRLTLTAIVSTGVNEHRRARNRQTTQNN